MINDASVVIGGGNWGIKEADVLGYKLINSEYYARDIDFANSTAAGTYTDSTGVVRKAPYNLFTYSEQFDNAAWSKQRSTISENVTTSPNGTLTADKLIETNVNGTHIIFFGVSQPSTPRRNQTFSFYAKAGERNWIATSGDMGTTYFNLATGEVGTVTTSTFWFSGITASMQNVGNGWYRCVLSGFGFFEYNVGIKLATANGTDSYTGDGTSGAFIWGAQLVEGTEALPYFPTTTRLNVPRIDYRNADGSLSTTGRLLLEPQRTNSIRNSSMVGAVAGSPGTLPTNWAVTNLSGLTQTIVGTGIENGLPYFDIRYNGTATSTSSIDVRDEATTQIAAANGQSWTHTAYLRLVSAVVPPASVQVGIYERTSAGIFVVGGFATAAITSTLQRFSINRTLSGGATVAFTQPLIQFSVNNATAYDFTIRIAAPQMELGAYATTWIPTTTAAVTRNADSASKTGVSSWIGQTEGTLYMDCNIRALSIFQDVFGAGVFADNVFIRLNSSNQIQAVATNAGTVNVLGQSTAITSGSFKIAFAYKNGDHALVVNGASPITSTSTGVLPSSMSALNVGSIIRAAALEGSVKQAIVFPTRLTNSQLQSLTTL